MNDSPSCRLIYIPTKIDTYCPIIDFEKDRCGRKGEGGSASVHMLHILFLRLSLSLSLKRNKTFQHLLLSASRSQVVYGLLLL